MLDVIVLAGGYAERLWPLTEDFPKALLSVAGAPVLNYVVSNVASIPEEKNIIVAVDADRVDMFAKPVEYLANQIGMGIRISSHQPHVLPRGKAIKTAVEKIAEILADRERYKLTSDRILILGADNVFGVQLGRFIAYQRQAGVSAIAVHRRPIPVDGTAFGIPTLDKAGQLVAFEEKPPIRGAFSLLSTACYLLLIQDAERVKQFLSEQGEETLGSYIRWLRSTTKIYGFEFGEEWHDIGTRDGLLAANRFLLPRLPQSSGMPSVSGTTKFAEPVLIEDGVEIRDSTIGPNVFLARGTKVVGSVIENSVVYEDTRITNCELRDSIVGSGSRVEGRVSEAVFGPRSSIVRT